MSSMYVTSEITLNLSRPNSGTVVYAKQYDKDSRVIDINLINGSEVWDPPDDTEIVVLYVKPDGNKGIYDVVEGYPQYSEAAGYEAGNRVINTGYVYQCTTNIEAPAGSFDSAKWNSLGAVTPAVQKLTDPGKVRLTLAEQALTCAGNTFVEISFYTNELRTTTLSFILAVESGVSDDMDLISSEYFNVLSELIQGVMGSVANPPKIGDNGDWYIWDTTLTPPGYADSGYSSVGQTGEQGPQGWSIVSVTRTSGTGEEGTTDVYTVKNNNPDTTQQVVGTFNVYNGRDGSGSKGSRTPLADSGSGSAGSYDIYSSEDHVHPLNVPVYGYPSDLGDATNGTAGTYARSDHVHSLSAVLDAVYPVGAIYMSMQNIYPGELFGGEWEQIRGKFLLSAYNETDVDPEDNEYAFQIIGAQGGEVEHTLTTDEIPAHGHLARIGNSASSGAATIGNWSLYMQSTATGSNFVTGKFGVTDGTQTLTEKGSRRLMDTDPTGGGEAHNNMPPFLAVYMWMRTE